MNWDAFKHLVKYAPTHIQLKDIDTDFVRGFRRCLDTKVKTKREFSIIDPDGYYLTITEFHKYEG